MNRWRTEDFEGNEKTMYDIVMMNACHCPNNVHRMYKSES